jgi:hypothetical protein
MREWVSSLESIVDNKLRKWKKESRIENGECVQVEWQFEQTHIIMDIFWLDSEETVKLHYFGPRAHHSFIWHGLTDKTFNKVQDRVGNLAQVTMHPPIDPSV